MISQKKIIALSKQYHLRAELIERDYVMNLILDALARSPATKGKVFFKGGCCIHKCFSGFVEHTKQNEHAYFSERFSNDIDLTVTPDLMSTEALLSAFAQVAKYIQKMHGVSLDQFSFPIHQNEKQNKANCRGYLHFQGPLFNPKFNAPKLKLDITADETTPILRRPVLIYDPYEQQKLYALCYSQEDLIAEKLRALMERTSARDLYDLSLLMTKSQQKNNMDMALLGDSIEKKFALKDLPIDFSVETFEQRKKAFSDDWRKSLEQQIGSLPPFEQFWNRENISMILSFAQSCVHANHMAHSPLVTAQRKRWKNKPSLALRSAQKE